MTPWSRNPARAGLVLAVLLATAGPVRAERLPVRAYTTEDGLPSNLVSRIYPDSDGFLWFGTRHGLARHDGHLFVTFDEADGIPRVWIADILETRDGQLLVATRDGLYWFDRSDPGPGPLFRLLRPENAGAAGRVRVLFQDRLGTVWCGTTAGLYRAEFAAGAWSFQAVPLGENPEQANRGAIAAIAETGDALWVGTHEGVAYLPRAGDPELFTMRDGLPSAVISSLYADVDDRVWVGTDTGLCVIALDPATGTPIVHESFGRADGLIADRLGGRSGPTVLGMHRTRDGRFWAATSSGLAEYQPGASGDEPAFRTYAMTHGLSDRILISIAEDMAGNLWLGTEATGAMKLAAEGFTRFGLDDGLGDLRISSMFEDHDGEMYVVSEYGNGLVHRFDGRRFHAVRPNIPDSISDAGWGWGQVTFRDRAGEWWVPTFSGLVRFPAVGSLEELEHLRPVAVYTRQDGLRADKIFRLYEDSVGDVWIGTMDYDDPNGNTVQRWDRSSGTFHDHGGDSGVPRDTPTAFVEDRAGNLWIAFYNQGVGRFRDGRFELFPAESGAPDGYVEGLFLDREGRIWIATVDRGVVRVDRAESDRPTFTAITAADGLSGDYVRCVAQDRVGRIYLGHLDGVDRINPSTGAVRHFTSKDGLPTTYTVGALTDGEGAVWIGTYQGVSRLMPSPERPSTPPRAWIQSIRIAGLPIPLHPLGHGIVEGLVLDPNRRQLEIEASGLAFAAGEILRFQYRLEHSGEWSEPSVDRKVNLAGLSPGGYHFEVRAVDSDGRVSLDPAVVSFRVLPPFWRRGWFVALIAALIAGLAYAAHRSRLKRVLELERVRTRIATDLHDDIGASLSQVSILSEVVRQQVHGDDPKAAEPLLDQIAGTARDLVDSMGDIVWAVNPKKDRAGDLVQRMRRFASDTFSGKGITFRFESSAGDLGRKLDVGVRRQVYLVFKEAVHNTVRHAGCEEAQIEFGIEARELVLRVSDDGRGFDPAGPSDGHGLASMRQRAGDLAGSLEIESATGQGTKVTLRVPLK